MLGSGDAKFKGSLIQELPPRRHEVHGGAGGGRHSRGVVTEMIRSHVRDRGTFEGEGSAIQGSNDSD